MIRFRPPLTTRTLLFALLWAAACDTASSGPAVVDATILDHGAPVSGAVAVLRSADHGTAPAFADSAGRVRVELADARGAGLLEVARDTAQARPEHVYAPLLLAPGARARLVIELDAETGHQVHYVSDTPMARWGRAAETIVAIEHDHYVAYNAWVEAGQVGRPVVDLDGTVDSIRAALSGEDDPEVRAALWAALMTAGQHGAGVSAMDADLALSVAAPGAAIWQWRPQSVPAVARYAAMLAEGAAGDSLAGQELAGRRELAVRRADAYVDRALDAFDGTGTQAEMLYSAVLYAALTGRNEEAFSYYDRLEAGHSESQWTEWARSQLPNPDIALGAPVPDVPLPALDSTAPPITADQLAGPATLVDFWAAWCTPCVAEMPAIHDAYRRFHDRGFDVVSISFDATRDDVAAFRRRYPMPWRHAFVGAAGLSDGAVASAWGVHGLPAAFLIGADGTIIALENELRGEKLAETLERVLGE